MLKEKYKLILKIALIHVLTYIVCGIAFSTLFSYQESLKITNEMRDMNNIIVQLSPIFQIVRGLLFGIVVILIKPSFSNKKYDWLRLWFILIVLGIFNTPATAPFSIEEFIYYKPSSLSWNLQLGGLAEVLTQTLLFSLFAMRTIKIFDIKNTIKTDE